MTQQLPLLLPHDAAMGADDFLVTPCNSEAAAWIDKWPEWPTHGLIVTGLPGSGKTHLMSLWLQKTGGSVVAADDLIDITPPALMAETKCIALDNANFFAGNGLAEKQLFHLFNFVKENKGFLLLTMATGAGQAGFELPDLRSRLLTLPVAALLPPDDELLEALIVKQFSDRQVAVDAGVVAYIASRAARDAASIRAIVQRLDLAALAEGCKITIPLARRILEKDNDD
jgi:chromosomal replication initiation ATPase DnaA